MKILFFGTPDYVLPVLKELHKKYNTHISRELVGVVTQEPKRAGRNWRLQRSAVYDWAEKHKLDIYTNLADIPQADLGVLAAYGKIIPEEIIKKFTHGIVNIHPSLLPKYRGASPIYNAIKNADTETGVTLIKLDDEMDHGPIISSFGEDILQTDTTESLRSRLFEKSADFLINLLPSYLSGKITLKEQDHTSATFTNLLKKSDGFISLKRLKSGDPKKIHCLIRASHPWPGAWTTLPNSKRLKILEAHLEDGKLVLDLVQLEGKNPVSYRQFKETYSDLLE